MQDLKDLKRRFFQSRILLTVGRGPVPRRAREAMKVREGQALALRESGDREGQALALR